MKPLDRTIRSRMFWACILLFIVGTPILIGYSQGYRLDDALSLVETGGLYLYADVPNASVYLDDDFIELNGAFLRNTFIQNLTPNHVYTIRFEKEGYHTWTKHLTVHPNIVTEARVLMVPKVLVWKEVPATSTVSLMTAGTTTHEVENPEHTEVRELFAEDGSKFAVRIATTTTLIARGKRIATTTTATTYVFPEWLETLASTSQITDRASVRERDGVVMWLDTGTIVATWGSTNDPRPYYLSDVPEEIRISDGGPYSRLEFYPNRNDIVLAASPLGVYAIELDNRSPRNAQPLSQGKGLDFRIDRGGTLVIFDGTAYRETSW